MSRKWLLAALLVGTVLAGVVATLRPRSGQGEPQAAEACQSTMPAGAPGLEPDAPVGPVVEPKRPTDNGAQSDPVAPFPGPSSLDEEYETHDEWIERLRREALDRLNELLEASFGEVPSNPVRAIGELSEETRLGLLREQATDVFPAAEEIGMRVGEAHSSEEWLSWFEDAGPRSGRAGPADAAVFFWAVNKQARALKRDDALARRVLAVIDSYLAELRGKAISLDALGYIWSAFGEMCPVRGGIELIRRWIVETPHGHEEVETRLASCLERWPLQEVTPLIIEILNTRRGGGIKGIVSAWSDTKRPRSNSAWVKLEAEQVLEAPLADAVSSTDSSAAILYARIFAGEDLLLPGAQDIAAALLTRRDSAYCSSQAFAFLSGVDPYAAATTWTEWFNSDDSFKVTAACMAAPSIPAAAQNVGSMERMFELANQPDQPAELRGAAALALSQFDSSANRSVQVLSAWLQQSEFERPMLIAAGRMVHGKWRKEIAALLKQEADAVDRQPVERRTPMFLLATVEPRTALEMCEQSGQPARFDSYTILLVAATAEALEGDDIWQRAARVRAKCLEPEPEWMREIRQRLSGPNERAEQRVVGYARSRPGSAG
ncbi:MAG: hypothetical protein K8I27_10175 [Planctomycetes bacterium]|nr:hypothetical protein [Planctomycetota bacterium]